LLVLLLLLLLIKLLLTLIVIVLIVIETLVAVPMTLLQDLKVSHWDVTSRASDGIACLVPVLVILVANDMEKVAFGKGELLGLL